MKSDANCLFCKIIDQKIPSAKVYEDETVYAFKDIQPQAPVHYLFVPKSHVEGLDKLDAGSMNVMSDLYKALKTVALKEGLGQSGFRTVINTGTHGGQTVFHLHVHLIGGKQLGGSMTGL